MSTLQRRGWKKYDLDSNGNVSCTKVYIFFDQADDESSLYWSESRKQVKDDSRRIHLHDLTDVYLQKQTPVFLSDSCAEATEFNCLSLITLDQQWNLEAEDADQRADWLHHLNVVLEAGGKLVVQDSNIDESGVLDQSESHVGNLQEGLNFVRFFDNGEGKIEQEKILLFHAPSADGPGTLYWCSHEQKEAISSQSISLNAISEVLHGKLSTELLSSAASSFQDKNVVSVLSEARSLHVANERVEVVMSFLDGIKAVLENRGMEFLSETVADNAPPAVQSRRFSVAVQEFGAVSLFTHQELQQIDVSAEDPSTVLSMTVFSNDKGGVESKPGDIVFNKKAGYIAWKGNPYNLITRIINNPNNCNNFKSPSQPRC